MQKNTVRLRSANISDIGRNPARTKNEDSFGHFEGEFGELFLVCDGMGGHEGGEVASRLAIESIRQYFETNYLPGEEQAVIAQSIEFAQQKITERVELEPELTGMGTTLVLLLINGVSYYIAHSGDSRIYLSRGGALIQLTKDHSEVQMMVESGIITQEQASTHPRRNFITKAVGHTSYAPDISGPHILKQDDVFLLCSDGLTEHVKDDELHQQMEEEPQIACQNLVEMANDRGGTDNITIQIVQVQQCSPFTLSEELPAPPKKKMLPPLALIATLLVFLGAVFWYTKMLKNPGAVTKPGKKADTEEKKEAGGTSSTSDAVDVDTVSNTLGAGNSREKYATAFNKMRDPSTQAKELKFVPNSPGNQVIYIVPGEAIYVDYNKLAPKVEDGGYGVDEERIKALIALALLRSPGLNKLPKTGWEEQLRAEGTQAVSEADWDKAQEIFAKFDEENAPGLFNNRMAALKKRVKTGPYSISLEK